MDSKEFREYGKKMVDFVADHWDNMRDRTPLPMVKPGYINDLVSATPPSKPEQWEEVFEDLEKVVMEGHTYWHHPSFFSYYPSALSYPSILADILGGGLGGVGFTWKSSPTMTELEMTTLDWLVTVLGLPEHFKNGHEGPGCGIIQSTASDAALIAILAARAKGVEYVKAHLDQFPRIARMIDEEDEEPAAGDSEVFLHPHHDAAVFSKFVAYFSDQAHSCSEKGAMLAGVRVRKLKSTKDEKLGNYSVLPETLEAAIKEDRKRGLFPFIMVCSMGTTGTCGVDFVKDLAPICNRENIWVHVDAAYAGSFLICPEYRYMSEGMEMVDSFNYNAHKAMMINFDCSPLWFKDGANASKYFNVDILILQHEHHATTSDYRHLQVALGRRFRSLKIWFVLRIMGVERIQEYLRKQAKLAEQFAGYIEKDPQFEFIVPQHLGLVCFRLKNSSNEENEALVNAINDDHRIHLVPSNAEGRYFLRLSVSSQLTTEDDIHNAYDVIKEISQKLPRLAING